MSMREGIMRRARTMHKQGHDHARVDIIVIVRTRPNTWVAKVEYTYGRSSWNESVTFTRALKLGRKDAVVTITDTDFPADRNMQCVTERGDMPGFITDFLIRERW